MRRKKIRVYFRDAVFFLEAPARFDFFELADTFFLPERRLLPLEADLPRPPFLPPNTASHPSAYFLLVPTRVMVMIVYPLKRQYLISRETRPAVGRRQRGRLEFPTRGRRRKSFTD